MSKLTKSLSDRNLFGVCGGLSKYTGIDVSLIRILFVVGAICTGSIVLWVYLILALVLPNEK